VHLRQTRATPVAAHGVPWAPLTASRRALSASIGFSGPSPHPAPGPGSAPEF